MFTGVCLSTGGGLLPGGGLGPGVVPGPGGGLLQGGGAWWRPPGTATAAGGTHPPGMHFCFIVVSKNVPQTKNQVSPCSSSVDGF